MGDSGVFPSTTARGASQPARRTRLSPGPRQVPAHVCGGVRQQRGAVGTPHRPRGRVAVSLLHGQPEADGELPELSPLLHDGQGADRKQVSLQLFYFLTFTTV